MKLNAQNLQTVMGYLRNVAEVDPNDVIANAASQLTSDLERVRVPFDLDTLESHERDLVHYAVARRNRYVLLPGARHAVDLERREKIKAVRYKRLTA
jgi:hypothetical protein